MDLVEQGRNLLHFVDDDERGAARPHLFPEEPRIACKADELARAEERALSSICLGLSCIT
jgi:hypothetical protein